MVVVNVKWGKQKFEGVEVDVGEPVAVFKAQLFALTNVPPERQKVMGVKGGQLKDDADLSALGLKAAFRKASLRWHPDKVATRFGASAAPRAQHVFQAVLASYQAAAAAEGM